MFDGIDFGTVSRLKDQAHILWHLKVFGAVPAGLIDLHDNKRVGKVLGHLGQEEIHHLGVGPRENERGQQPLLRSDRRIDIAGLANAPAPTSIGSRAEVLFGNLTHIAAFAHRRPHRVRAYDRVKRPVPLVTRDIPAQDEGSSNGQSGETPQFVLPSLWDLLTTQTEHLAQSPQHLRPSAIASSPRQTGLWE